MKILIKSVTVVDKSSDYHGKTVNVVIDNGLIAEISSKVIKADKEIEAKGMFLTPGWFDMRAFFADPGFESKEDLKSGCLAAQAGGFTGVAVLPNNNPVTQSKNEVSYIRSGGAQSLVELYPIGAVTRDTKGEELTEMIDLNHAGAVAFSDGLVPIWHSDILLKTLQYLQKFDGLLINKPEDIHLNMFGVMNEGLNSTILGMKGMPKLAEEIIIQRDLALLAYAGGRLHISNISSEKSVALIKSAKNKGLKVSCDVAAYQMSFKDDALLGFDTDFKVNPPFREKKDNTALVKALKEGVIDVIVSSHTPQDEENKKLEFDLAEFGITSLQTVAHNISELSQSVDLEILLEKISTAPRELLKLPVPTITEGEMANLTLFNPAHEWVLDTKTNRSKSKNSPYWEKPLRGKAVAAFNKGKYHINDCL